MLQSLYNYSNSLILKHVHLYPIYYVKGLQKKRGKEPSFASQMEKTSPRCLFYGLMQPESLRVNAT